MHVLLLALGGLTAAVGLAFIGTGVTVHEGAAEVVVPGTIAAVGGFILVGLALAVRALQRIEQTLVARAVLQPERADEVAAAAFAANPVAANAVPANTVVANPAVAGQRAAAPPRVPFPPKPKAEPRVQPVPASATASFEPAEEPTYEHLREKFPTLVRMENPAEAEAADVSPLPRRARAQRAEEDLGLLKNASIGGRAVAAAPARAVPRHDSHARQPLLRERQKSSVFEAVWPNGQRLRRNGQAAPVQVAAPVEAIAPAPSPPPVELPPDNQTTSDTHAAVGEPWTAAEAAPPPAPGPVSVLKSGVVEGMAYTLYSDGSIEAQLPQGRLRFGSITELRNHIESDS